MAGLKQVSDQTKFRRQCERVADKLELGDVLFFPDSGNSEPFEDDGNLHVSKFGLRAVFDVGNGQSLSGAEQNIRTRDVLAALNMKRAIGERVLMDEMDDDDDCDHCYLHCP